MAKFNLKTAKLDSLTINEKKMDEQRESMNMSNEAQDVISKNINFSICKKNKDNTVPFNAQLESSRRNKENEKTIESEMDEKEVLFGEKAEQVSSINRESQKYDTEKIKKFKKAEEDKDTEFWDKYVGVQVEVEKNKIDGNISSSQLQNNPERFKGEKTKRMVSALKDADAMLFHIYASAKKEGRGINDLEKQQIIDINSGKRRILSRSNEGDGDSDRYFDYPPTECYKPNIRRENRDYARCKVCNSRWEVAPFKEETTCPVCNKTEFIGDRDIYQ